MRLRNGQGGNPGRLPTAPDAWVFSDSGTAPLHPVSYQAGRPSPFTRPGERESPLKSLLARLLLVVSVAMVPALGLQVYTESGARHARQRFLDGEALRLMHVISSEQARIADGAEQVLNVLSGAPSVQDGLADLCQRVLANLLKQSPRYVFAAVIGLDGHIVCGPRPVNPGFDAKGRAFFRLALQTGGFAVGEYVIGDSTRAASIHMARPFTDRNGVVAGVVALALSLDWLGQELGHLALPPGTAVSLFDRNGTVLARYPDGKNEKPIGQPLPAGYRFVLEGIADNAATVTGAEGHPVTVAYSPPDSDPKGWGVAVALDQDLAFARVAEANRTGLLLIMAGAALGLTITWLAGTHLIRRPFGRLLSAARRWRTGDLAARTGLHEDGSEFGILGAAFDDMALSLEARERDLRQSEGIFRAVFDQAAIGMTQTDLDGRWLRVNDRMCAILGYARSDLLGRRFADFTHPDDIEADLASRDALLAGEVGTINREKRYLRKDGGVVWASLAVFLLGDAEGRPERMVTIVEDITARRLAEDELRRLTGRLEERVREEVGAREAAQSRAAHAERMQALGQLAGGIAHDFNNVLQGVLGAATLIERKPGDEAGVRRLARLAVEASERGASITRRLLAFGRRADLRAEAFDVPPLLAGLQEILSHTIGSGIEVLVQLGADCPPLLADRVQLETALLNLATNARDAMPSGGRLTLSAGASEVPPSGLAPGRYVRITVADTGVGMDAAMMARATEPFFTTKGIGAGTGLGLPMARGFAEESGGALGIESSPGNGTAVTIWLPAAEPGAARQSEPSGVADGAAPSPIGQPAARVLLVDDERVVRHVLAEHLADAGFSVLSAADGDEALGLLDGGESVDAMVTDLAMPGMDGIALIRAVQERRHGLPVVLLTGDAGGDAALALSGAVSGTYSMLRKPVTGSVLAGRVRALLDEVSRPPLRGP